MLTDNLNVYYNKQQILLSSDFWSKILKTFECTELTKKRQKKCVDLPAGTIQVN